MDIGKILTSRMGLEKGCLTGKVAVVTGGAMGIGRQTVFGLSILGADVAIVDKDQAALRHTAEQVTSSYGNCLTVVADIAAEGELSRAIEKILGKWQHIDIFVSNAAEAFIGSFEEESLEIWDKVFNTNLRFPALAIKSLLPGMLNNGYGVIANVIALEGLTYSTAYSASKVGMRSLTTSISTEIGNESGLSIFSFSPGIVDTPLVNNYFYPELAKRFGVTMQDLVNGIGGNPGYEGLMPVEDCGAGLVYCIANAENYNGQVASPFLPLSKAGIIDFKEVAAFGVEKAPTGTEEGIEIVNTSIKEYLKSVTKINTNLEHRIKVRTQELTQANKKLQAALEEVKQLSGMLPICSECKNVRDDKGYWNQIETYISEHTETQFSHSLCPICTEKLYSNESWFDELKNEESGE